MKKAKDHNNDELFDIFWNVDRDKYPDRYKEVCEELDSRNISYDDLPQWERNQRKLDDEIEAIGDAHNIIVYGYRYIIASIAIAGMIYAYFQG